MGRPSFLQGHRGVVDEVERAGQPFHGTPASSTGRTIRGTPRRLAVSRRCFCIPARALYSKEWSAPGVRTNPMNFICQKEKAEDIVRRCLKAYDDGHHKPPRELFIHGRTVFSREETEGFRAGAPAGTRVKGIQTRRPNDLKRFREGRRAVLRGVGLQIDNRNAFLWTSGYLPSLHTYHGREVPTPLKVRVVFGDTDLDQVLADIVALTKLNFNTCIFADGLPVTLRFAGDIGEILTAIPEVSSKPLPFRHHR